MDTDFYNEDPWSAYKDSLIDDEPDIFDAVHPPEGPDNHTPTPPKPHEDPF
jgi:hypothetical protein